MAKGFWCDPYWVEDLHPEFTGYEFDFDVCEDDWDETVELPESWFYPSKRRLRSPERLAYYATRELTDEHGLMLVASIPDCSDSPSFHFHIWRWVDGERVDEDDNVEYGPYPLHA